MNSPSTQTKSSVAKPLRKRSEKRDPVDIFIFLIPCLQFIHIQVIGVLSGSDLLLLGAFFYLALSKKIRITTPVGMRFLVFGLLWLASQCVTDIVRHTVFIDYARGWSSIGFTLINFVAIYTLSYGRPRRLMLYGWGLVVGNVLAFFISPNVFAADYPWKFGLCFPVTLAVFLFASREKCSGHWPIMLSAIIGVVNFSLGARSVGAICLTTALYLLVTRFLRKRGAASHSPKVGSIITICALLILAVAGIAWAYQYAASTGLLGEDARTKYEAQSAGAYGLLVGGRPDLLGALPAIYDSPILGHGSWAKDWTYLIEERRALAIMGYQGASEMSREELQDGVIPAHSYLLQSWVWAGIVGAFFWAWVFVLTARVLMRIYPATVVLLPVMSTMAFTLLWNILFSPYGATERIISPYYVVVLMTCWGMAPRKSVRAVPSIAKRKINTALTPRPQQ